MGLEPDVMCKGVRLVSVTQQLDFAGPAGKMITSVLFAVAEMEQQTRRERQAAGIAVAKRNGVYRSDSHSQPLHNQQGEDQPGRRGKEAAAGRRGVSHVAHGRPFAGSSIRCAHCQCRISAMPS